MSSNLTPPTTSTGTSSSAIASAEPMAADGADLGRLVPRFVLRLQGGRTVVSRSLTWRVAAGDRARLVLDGTGMAVLCADHYLEDCIASAPTSTRLRQCAYLPQVTSEVARDRLALFLAAYPRAVLLTDVNQIVGAQDRGGIDVQMIAGDLAEAGDLDQAGPVNEVGIGGRCDQLYTSSGRGIEVALNATELRSLAKSAAVRAMEARRLSADVDGIDADRWDQIADELNRAGA